ncbi:hypothetical protein AB0395_24490 [Streptosporangium sp. NPDC051023]|uniref:hypothetical protein n=1 Tax=Streptosporangium sp. NPDC051023 TaxID=3155410 RepID=UPI003450CE12
MTIDARAFLSIAEQAVAIAAEIVKTHLPGAVTTKGDGDMATDYADGSPHTMNAHAVIVASPKILTDLVELIAEADKDARHSALCQPREILTISA